MVVTATAVLDKVMRALELASFNSRRKGAWATIPETKAYADEAEIAVLAVNQRSLEELVQKDRAERRYPVSNRNRMYRPVNAGGAGGSGDALGTIGRAPLTTVPWSMTVVPPPPTSVTHAVVQQSIQQLM